MVFTRVKEFLAILPVAILVACASSPNDVLQTSGSDMSIAEPAGWQKVVPGEGAQCSDGSEFAFYARRGNPEKLAFFLQGGGGCWNMQTCDPLGKPSYTVNLEGFHPSQSNGVFDFSRDDNPLRDHTVVFVPYCSGDVHIGDATREYTRTPDWSGALRKNGVSAENIAPTFIVQHKGLANARSALKWVQREVPAPKMVLVTGSSAGSIPSPYYAVQLAKAYPEAQVSQLGDGSGGYRRMSQSASPHLAWGSVPALASEPEFSSLSDANFNFELLYMLAQDAAPDLRLHAYDTAEDNVQLQFLKLSGLQVDSLQQAIELNQADIRKKAPTFRSFVAGGELHTILRRPEFYTYRVGKRTVREWFTDIVEGRLADNVVCQECEVAQQ